MLALPTIGFSRSVTEHNVELDVLCDWIEGSVLFCSDRLSERDVVDILCENHIYAKQGMASQRVTNAWSELRRRQLFIGDASPYEFDSLAIKLRKDPWKEAAAHSFCVLLSLSKWFKGWAAQFGHDYTEQGELFEAVTKESVEALYPGWKVHPTGWSRNSAKKLDSVVSKVALLLGEPKGDVEKWTTESANEAGLDLVCYSDFPDGRGGYPTLLFQCASGGDWAGKLHTPQLKIWTRIIEFRARGFPRKAFATPFAFLDSDFTRNCNLVDGLLLDRYRLLSAARGTRTWLSASVAGRIECWAKGRVAKLPRLA